MKNQLRKTVLLSLGIMLIVSAGIAFGQEKEETVKCPVSGEVMKKADAKITAVYQSQTFYFCCQSCKTDFLKEPGKYLKTVYTCPMHIEVQVDKPGKCPKCGMNLEARLVQKNLGDQNGAAGEKAVMCNKCKTVWVFDGVRKAGKSTIIHRVKQMVCPDCTAAAKAYFMTEKLERSCKSCGGELDVCELSEEPVKK